MEGSVLVQSLGSLGMACRCSLIGWKVLLRGQEWCWFVAELTQPAAARSGHQSDLTRQESHLCDVLQICVMYHDSWEGRQWDEWGLLVV